MDRDTLEEKGWTVHEVGGAAAGAEAAVREKPETTQLKVSPATLPVIFITALDDEETRAQQQAGCVVFLRKPYSARQLVDAIQKAVP